MRVLCLASLVALARGKPIVASLGHQLESVADELATLGLKERSGRIEPDDAVEPDDAAQPPDAAELQRWMQTGPYSVTNAVVKAHKWNYHSIYKPASDPWWTTERLEIVREAKRKWEDKFARHESAREAIRKFPKEAIDQGMYDAFDAGFKSAFGWDDPLIVGQEGDGTPAADVLPYVEAAASTSPSPPSPSPSST